MELNVEKINTAKIWSLSFVFVTLANAFLFMVFEMLLPTLPLFVTAIGGGAKQVGYVTGIFMISAIAVRPFAGALALRFNKKYLLILGIVISAFSTGAYYLASDVSVLLLIRLIHGAGFGLATTYFATIAAEIIPKERRGEGIGYFGVGETIAVSVGPMIGIAALELYDFQRLFLGGMSVLLLAVLMAVFVRRQPETTGTGEKGTAKLKVLEKRVLFPSILILFVGIAASGIMSFFSLYAIEKGFHSVGMFFFLIAGASFFIRLISGRTFDRYGAAAILIPASLFSIAGLSILYFAQTNAMFFTAAICYGFGFGSIFPAIQTWCINLVEEHEHEDAMGTFFNFFDMGIGGGSLLLGLVATVYSYREIYITAIFMYLLFLLLYILYICMKRKTA
ncbi:MFS transporter [Bacillus paralicheniformis]|uniref:Major facilitator superfamily (MFS) profile domain-containing protein n=1 Tax=Bacillus paralicheniformis TaxID=1648923 RepID=A0A7Z0WUL5_9BACI|nr:MULTISPECIES: MFS transporter [Bacillus]POO77216.1 MFS transporter [Bacillus sp. MBGLi97]MCU4668237.1 MFS transporter [Bacillus paralicheniformis]MDU0414329.1 MFS transporter [Bacillus paralicheniformis]MDW6053765.1 MFS transporter [Bacillus paralicheniformis]MED1068371.1 MFS transporter [Bacillus paralicheniformis]